MYDVIVVGAGVEGLGPARYLAKSNANVLLLDQVGIDSFYRTYFVSLKYFVAKRYSVVSSLYI